MVEAATRPGVVPYITAWSEEQYARFDVVAHPAGGIAYRDEVPHDRDADGVLWARMTHARGQGRPDFGRVHFGRQRRAMRALLCQVCGGPASRTDEGVLWLLKDDRADWPGWPEGMAATHPPVCLACARTAARRCPHLRGGCVAVRAREFGTRAVYGSLYRPGVPAPVAAAEVIAASREPRARWVLATQMVRVLRQCSFVDLAAETGLPRAA
ncbi:hypothetical protein OG455_14710 [Kitasatospora sp. NBC_01287]|uniref:hypothetical protein n=1 Tax=Kitasatospora sp. NBC_01287 TaxID=2903573 RepID=UPI0022594F10|nr:hypothetical protein [Kitasatospora sp. NBC_01287]MCX4746756.1 hypothetical protein [Kitasatospora sp. NBC_01287]